MMKKKRRKTPNRLVALKVIKEKREHIKGVGQTPQGLVKRKDKPPAEEEKSEKTPESHSSKGKIRLTCNRKT